MIEHTNKDFTFEDASAAFQRTDAYLVRRFLRVPHECSDKSCPGDLNRRKLAVYDNLLAVCRLASRFDNIEDGGPSALSIANRARDTLAEAEEVAGGV